MYYSEINMYVFLIENNIDVHNTTIRINLRRNITIIGGEYTCNIYSIYDSNTENNRYWGRR